MSKFLFRCLLAWLVFLYSWSVLALQDATDLSQIDIIFFEHVDTKRFDAEIWPKFVGKLDTRRAINLNEVNNDSSISKLENQKMLLSKEAKIIKHSKSHQFIEQVAWSQSLPVGAKSTPVLLQLSTDSSELEALIAIKPTRNVYNVNFDFIYKIKDREFRISRDFKLKKKEIYYIDHPIVSAMLMISPLPQ